MDISEIAELFETEMTNEIFHTVKDEALQAALIESVKNVKATILDTYASSITK